MGAFNTIGYAYLSLDDRVDERWREERQEIADMIARGETYTLSVPGKPDVHLDYWEIDDWLYRNAEDEIHKAMALCVMHPELGGKHVKRLVERAALAVTDQLATEIKSAIRRELIEQ